MPDVPSIKDFFFPVLRVPNVPWYGVWSIAEVTGEPYAYDIPAAIGDLGHIVPVRPLLKTDGQLAVVNPRNALVDARLRGTMRAMRRMWRIDRLGEAVNALVTALREEVDLGEESGSRPSSRRSCRACRTRFTSTYSAGRSRS